MPAVVVAKDEPQGVILWANKEARAVRILPGHRYAHALSLTGKLRAGVIATEEIDKGVAEVTTLLGGFSPSVDPMGDTPGVFWLDAGGLESLYGSTLKWAQRLHAALKDLGFVSAVVLGYTRFGTYAVARARRGVVTHFDSESAERAAARQVPLELLDVAPALRDALRRLGVRQLGELIRLPGGSILERFGTDAHRLYQLATGEGWDPLRPAAIEDPNEARIVLDDPEEDRESLLFLIKGGLDQVLARLADNKRSLSLLYLELSLYRQEPAERLDCIRPASPTLDGRSLLRLVHLRLENDPPASGVTELRIWADDVAATREQLSLFAQKPKRSLLAANEALARLRAEFGDDAVVRATVREGHLPEARYGWERLSEVKLPMLQERSPSLIRRVFDRPILLPPQSAHVRDDGWLLSGLEHGAVAGIHGPYIVSGGWWMSNVHREYHFAETRRGDCLWVYYDRRRRRWFLHGAVE